MPTIYQDGIPPPYRIQKRLALNRCFRIVQQRLRQCGQCSRYEVTYVTLGGADLYDVMDFLAVFDIRDTKLAVVSYEIQMDIAAEARKSAVAKLLEKVDGCSVEVVPRAFQGTNFDPLEQHKG